VAKCGNEEEDTHGNTFDPTRGSEHENVEEKESVEGKENSETKKRSEEEAPVLEENLLHERENQIRVQVQEESDDDVEIVWEDEKSNGDTVGFKSGNILDLTCVTTFEICAKSCEDHACCVCDDLCVACDDVISSKFYDESYDDSFDHNCGDAYIENVVGNVDCVVDNVHANPLENVGNINAKRDDDICDNSSNTCKNDTYDLHDNALKCGNDFWVTNEVIFFNPCDFNDSDSFDSSDDDENCFDTCENNSFNSTENNSIESCEDNFSNPYDSNSSNPRANNSLISLDDNDGLSLSLSVIVLCQMNMLMICMRCFVVMMI